MIVFLFCFSNSGADTRFHARGFEIRSGGPGGILTQESFKIRSSGWDFRHSEAKTACYNVSLFYIGALTELISPLPTNPIQ